MDLMQVIDQIGREKGIEKGILIDAVGAAILSASRKSLPAAQAALDLRVDFDGKTEPVHAVRGPESRRGAAQPQGRDQPGGGAADQPGGARLGTR